VALCPNEALTAPADTPWSMKNAEPPGPVYCSGLLARGPMPANALPPFIIPCVGSIPTSLMLARALRDKESIEVITGVCEGCSMKAGEEYFRKRVRETQSLFDFLGVGFPPAKITVGSDNERQAASKQIEAFQASVAEKEAFSRRDFFRRFRERTATSPSMIGSKDTTAATAESVFPGPTQTTRLLIELFRRFLGDVPRKDRVPVFTEIQVGDNCTGCGACAHVCPTGALAFQESQASAELVWTTAHCSHCDLCLDACSRKALHVLPCHESAKVARETRTVVKRFPRSLCPECGRPHLAAGSETLCRSCEKAGNLVETLSSMIYGEPGKPESTAPEEGGPLREKRKD
jgi:energy-converting hydrogenase B subunit K